MIILFQILLLVTLMTSSCFAEIEVFLGGERFKSFEDSRKRVDPPQVESKFDQISFNKGVDRSLLDFNNHWNNPLNKVDPPELETVFRKTIGKNREPALLISDAGKLRIMSFETKFE